jgi:osmotically-inducible protein OsmY
MSESGPIVAEGADQNASRVRLSPAVGEVFFNGKPFKPDLLEAQAEPSYYETGATPPGLELVDLAGRDLAGLDHAGLDHAGLDHVDLLEHRDDQDKLDENPEPDAANGHDANDAVNALSALSAFDNFDDPAERKALAPNEPEPMSLGAVPSLKPSFLASRSKRERKAGAIMAVGVVGLFVVQLSVVRPAIERKLVKRAEAVLLLDGARAVNVSASGRDLSLTGYVASDAAKKRAISLVQARRGVRVVNGNKLAVDAALAAAGGSLSLGDNASTDSPAPVRTGDGAGDQGTPETAVPAADATNTETAAALDAERAKPMRRAKIVVRVASGRVTIEGTVPSEEGRDQLLGRSRQNLGEEQVTDLLVLPAVSEERADLNDYRRVGQLLSIISSFPGAEISLNYDRGTLQLSGTVTTNNDLALAQGEIRKLVPDESLRTTQLAVGTPAAPASPTNASTPNTPSTIPA